MSRRMKILVILFLFLHPLHLLIILLLSQIILVLLHLTHLKPLQLVSRNLNPFLPLVRTQFGMTYELPFLPVSSRKFYQ